ncbi:MULTISPECIES: hypothetical protein [unclassified Streptomyces]|uniref:hypothetical protein n=1 Tax=unclassified Streptomyces TaxID=2593676 RepID=UPI00380AF5E0
MKSHSEDPGDVSGGVGGRALVPVDEAVARAMTTGIREAIGDVRRSVAVLAERVRAAHEARVWVALSQPSWAAYCETEFGVSRAQAYRLLDIARAADVILAAVTAADPAGLSRMRDTAEDSAATVAGAVVDFGLSQRALLAVAGRVEDVADLITRRLAILTQSSGSQSVDADAVRAIVHQAVHDVRNAPPPPAALPTTSPAVDPAVDPVVEPFVAEGRRVVDELVASAHAIGELMLEVAPAYLGDAEAADRLALLCEQIGEPLEHGLASRRYVLSGDRRALDGIVL